MKNKRNHKRKQESDIVRYTRMRLAALENPSIKESPEYAEMNKTIRDMERKMKEDFARIFNDEWEKHRIISSLETVRVSGGDFRIPLHSISDKE